MHNKEELIQPIQMNIFQSNLYKTNFSWQNFFIETRGQVKQQEKNKQPCKPISVALPTYLYRN